MTPFAAMGITRGTSAPVHRPAEFRGAHGGLDALGLTAELPHLGNLAAPRLLLLRGSGLRTGLAAPLDGGRLRASADASPGGGRLRGRSPFRGDGAPRRCRPIGRGMSSGVVDRGVLPLRSFGDGPGTRSRGCEARQRVGGGQVLARGGRGEGGQTRERGRRPFGGRYQVGGPVRRPRGRGVRDSHTSAGQERGEEKTRRTEWMHDDHAARAGPSLASGSSRVHRHE